MVLVQCCLDALECLGDVRSGVVFHRHRARLVTDDDVVLEERAGVLGDRLDRAAGGAPCRAIDRVGVAHGDDVGVLLVHVGVQDEARPVDRVAALDHAARMIHQDQVGQLHLVEVHAHRVGPVQLRMLRVAHRQVAGKAIVEALLRKRPARAHQAFLAVAALVGHVVELGQLRKDQALLFGLIHRDAVSKIKHGRVPSGKGCWSSCRGTRCAASRDL